MKVAMCFPDPFLLTIKSVQEGEVGDEDDDSMVGGYKRREERRGEERRGEERRGERSEITRGRFER